MATLQERLDAYKKASGKSGDTRSLAERVQSYKTAGRDNIVSRLNKWFTNNDIFVSNYQKRTAGTTGSYDDKFDSGASSWLETVTNQKNNFDIEARAIKSYLETNRDEFDSEWLDNALKSLSAAQKNQESILAGTKSFNDYWSQWDTEESYNQWAAGMKDREAKLNYDLRAGAADISRLETIQSNASAIVKRITDLENTLEARRKYAMRMGTTTLIGSSKEEAELSALKAEYDSKYKNFNLDELAAEINDKKSYYTLAERMQSAEALKNDAMSATDFETYAAKGAAIKNPTYAEANGSDNFLGWKNPFAKGEEIQNIVTYARDNDAALQMAGAGAANSGDIAEIEGIRLYNLMADDEVKVYNYYIGKGDRASADAYLESLTDTLNQRKAGEMYKGIEGNTALEMVFGVAAGLDQFTQGVANLFNGDDYIPTSSSQYLSGMIREDLADNGPNVLGSSLGQIGYDLITTGSNMLPSILIGGGFGAALLGASAGGNAKAEMLRMGYSKDQATAYGVLVGASESLLEYAFSGISSIGGKAWQTLGKSGIASKVDNILGNISVKAPGIVIALGKTLGGAAGEAFEEGLQSILEPWFKSFVVGGDIEAPDWEEVAYSSLLGALSGGVFEGIGSAATVSSVSGVGRNIKKTQGVSKLLELGQNYSADSVAYKLAGKINNTIKNGGKVNAYSIGQLFIEEGATLSAQNISDLTRGLEELGWDSKSAATMANAYAELLEGTIDMTDDVRMIFSENQPLTQALIKKLINENTTVLQRTKGYAGLDSLVNKKATASQKETVAAKPTLTEDEVSAYEAAEAMIRADQKKLGFEASRDIARGMVEETAPARDAVDRVYKALNVKGEYSYSEGKGVTVKSTGEAAEVADVVSTKDGNLKVKLTDGKTLDAKELNFRSEGEALVYETVANLGVDAATAWSIIKNYDPNGKQRGDEYALGAVEAFRYGKLGEKNISSKGFAAKLTESQRKLAYDLGRLNAKNEAEARQKRISEAVSKMAKKRESGALTYDKSVDVSSLREEQKAQADILGKVAEGLGVKVHLFASSEVDGKAYFKAPDGSEISDNGWYDPETGEIWVDVNAGNSRRGLILITAAHELTHFIKDWSPAKYKVFADFLVKTYNESGKSVDELVRDRMNKSKHDLSYDEAYDEIVARSCESFLMDRDVEMRIAELTNKDKTLAQKIKTFIGHLLAKFKKLAEDLGLAPESEEAKLVAGMTDTLQELHNLWVDALADAGKSYSKVGMAIDMSSESASPMFSERTWTASEYVTDRDAAAKKLVEALGVTYAQAKKYIDNVNSIAKAIANDRVRLDYEASSFGSAFVSNVEYGGSFDYTTLCKKRRIYTGTFQEIQKRIGDAVLSPDDILEIRNMMIAEGIEATCGLCYVEGSRANMGKFAKKFIELYKRDNPDGWTPTMVDVNTPDGVEQMRINHPEAYDQYEYFWNHYGKLKDSDPALFASQQKPKLYEARKEYKGEILQHFKDVDTIAKKNLNGGIRMQSFSDFEIVHLIDTMQVIMDMAQVGLAGQAYTKVPEFADAFGNTGLKINLSLIAKGVDSDGKLIFDDREGMPHETAFKLRNKYSANVGTIIVAFTDEQLRAAMADPRIDFIIPFHRSQWKKSQYGAMGLPKGTKDYTFMQNEKLIKQTYHEYQGRMVKDKATNYKPNEYWDFSKSGKENAEAYLEMCAKENKRPKFYKLLDYDGNGKYSLKEDGSTDGYWKLLIDFKMYDNDGVGVPQSAVTPNFSMDEAMAMLEEYKGGHQSYPVAHGVVDKFIENYNSKAYSADFSKTGLKATAVNAAKFDKVKFSERERIVSDTVDRAIEQKGDLGLKYNQQQISKVPDDVSAVVSAASDGRINIEKKYVALNGSDIWHEYERRTDAKNEIGRRQIPLTAETIKEAIMAIYSPDMVESLFASSQNPTQRQSFAYAKKSPKGYYIVVEAVGGKRNPNVVPVMLLQFNEAKWNEMVSAGKTLGELLYENDTEKRAALDIEFNKKNRVTVAQFASKEAIANTPRSPRFEDIISHPDEFVNSNSKKYSERDTDAITEREVLAEALESAAQNDIERARLKEYKAEIGKYEGLQEELRGVRAEITEIYNSTGKRDTERLRALKDRATELETNISTYDKKLLRLEAAKPLRNVLKREVESTKYAEKVEARKRESDARLAGRMAQGRIDAETIRKKDEQIKALREQRDRKLLEQKENFREQKERAAERRDKTTMRAKIRDRVNSLNKLLLNETKDKHIPMHLQKPVAELLSIINMESSDNEKVKAKLQVLKSEYEAIAKSNDPVIAAGYHPEVAERIGSVAEFIGDTALKDMDLEQLDYLYETLTIVESVIRKANKGFKIAKGQTIESYAQSTMAEIREVGGSDHMSNDVLDLISRYRWSNLKPIYAFERIGSKTFTELFNNVRAGEDVWSRDVSDARAFFLENANKYDYFGWDMEKTYSFKDKFGKDFELTLPQMMSLYAYSKRGQADLHLEEGGFVYEDSVKVKKKSHGIPIKYTVKTANTFALRREHLALVVAAMTEEQRGFVDAMQDYLSTTMGEKGNEVSREMYGINLFKEKNYFPLKSSSYYMSYNPEKDAQSKIKNYGMAKELVKNANNPIVLSDFMKVWGQHIDEMSMYHAFVLPMEDFSKVFNFNTPTSDDVRKQSIQAALTNAYGDASIAYIKGLLTDLNGGARSDPTIGMVNSLMSKFKKAKVFLSWSVIIQQPSAIGRAFAIVNPKYFKPNLTQGHNKTWEELKKYAPVAIIKEMGYFDTNVGQSTVDYLSAPEYRGLWQKAKGILTDEDYRDAAMGKLPSLADEATWNYIWQAVKNEIADTTDLAEGSEELLKAAGARFTEVIVKTQVYDSVLSRSAFMRSKDGLAKMITAFLAEPTTSANMMSNALLQSKRGDKKGLGITTAAVVTSVALNSVLVSLVRAMRDDDEDEAWGEKYVESLISELLDGLNPITYLPVLKDIWSIAQGYDVERTDMSLFADLIAAIETLFNDSKTAPEKVEGLLASSANFAGLPLENVIRDVKSVINLAKLIGGDLKTTPGGLEDAAINAVRDTIPFIDKLIPSESKSDKLYEAILRGDEVEIERAESGYSDDDAVASATKKALRENDPRVRVAARALADNDIREFGRIVSEIASEGKFDSETVESAVRSEADSFKSKIKVAAEVLRDGNNDEYQSIVRQLRKTYKGVYTQDEIVAAVKAYKFTEKTEEVAKSESIYKSSDVNAALAAGDGETALAIVRELISVNYENEIAKAKRKAEESGERFIEWRARKDAERAANAAVRKTVTEYWKPLYLEAFKNRDVSEMNRIRRLLYGIGIYGNLSELDKTLAAWKKS